jgi:hypothetical protein
MGFPLPHSHVVARWILHSFDEHKYALLLYQKHSFSEQHKVAGRIKYRRSAGQKENHDNNLPLTIHQKLGKSQNQRPLAAAVAVFSQKPSQPRLG